MFRKLFVLALVIIALHVAAVLTLGTSPAGSLIGNLLQIASSGLAVAAVFAASQRATGLSRRFWLLVGCGLAVWGVANVGWTYYEIALHAEPPTGSVVRFLFGTQVIFWALAVFLNQDKESSTLDLESVLDFVQITIVFFFIYLGFYYIPSYHLDARTAYMREVWMQMAERLGLVLLAAVQAKRARSIQIRKLYQGFAVYLLGYTGCVSVADYVQTTSIIPTAPWYDPACNLPPLVEPGLGGNDGAGEYGIHRRPAMEGYLRAARRGEIGRGDPPVPAEERKVVWACEHSPAGWQRGASGNGDYRVAGRRCGLREPRRERAARRRKRACAGGSEVSHAGRTSGSHQLTPGARLGRQVAILPPA